MMGANNGLTVDNQASIEADQPVSLINMIGANNIFTVDNQTSIKVSCRQRRLIGVHRCAGLFEPLLSDLY